VKIKTVILSAVAAVLVSCLQAAYNNPLLDYMPPGLQDVPVRFSSPGGSDMLIVSLSGGAFKDTLAYNQFELTKNAVPVTLNKPIRDSDTLVILNFDSSASLESGAYALTVKQGAFREAANRVTVQAVSSGTWTAASGGSFGSSRIWQVGYGNGKFVALGADGKMAYSSDGASWMAINPGYSGVQSKFSKDIRGLAWGDDKFIAVGYEGRMASSDNGISWNGWTESMINGASLLCVAYGGGRFVAAGDEGNVIFLRDGGTWTKVNDSDFGDKSILALAYGGGVFVAAGADGALSYSSNDYDWQGADSKFAGSTIHGAAWGNGTFVVVGDEGKIAVSQDGINWNLVTGGTPFGGTGILTVSYGAGIFVAAGHNGKMASSTDGNSWTAMDPAVNYFTPDEQIQTLSYGGGKFVAAGNQYEHLGGAGRILCGYQKPPVEKAVINVTSSPFSSALGDNYLTITLTEGQFADAPQSNHFTLNSGTGGFANLNNGEVERVSDTIVRINGLTRVSAPGSGQTITIAAAAMRAQTAGVSALVTAGKVSTWNLAPSGNTAFGTSHIRGIAYNGSSAYIAVGAGKIASSADGVTWTEITGTEKDKWAGAADYVDFYGVAYGSGKFVAVGYWINGGENTEPGGGMAGWGVVAVSDDGNAWTIHDKVLTFTAPAETISPRVFGISWGSSRFIAVGRWGRAAWSADGSTWTAVQVDPFDYKDIFSIAYDGSGKFVAGGGEGKLAFSADGTSWTWAANRLLGEGIAIRSIGFGDQTFIAAGDGGNMKTALSADVALGTGADGGDNWTGVNSKFENSGILGIAWGSGKYVAVGHDGRMSESSDSKNWTVIIPGGRTGQNQFNNDEQISCIVYGGKFVVGGNAYSGNAGKIVYSD
jgi:hypothetical protein